MSLYLDTSCFLKLLFIERDSARVVQLVTKETRLVVSSLTHVEALVQIRAREIGGMISRREGVRVQAKSNDLLANPPFEIAPLSGGIFQVAERDARTPPKAGHCRTLDRLHLAAMETLALRRLLTNDDQQARAARALGFEVLMPH